MLNKVGNCIIDLSRIILKYGSNNKNTLSDNQLIEPLSRYHPYNKIYSDSTFDNEMVKEELDLSIVVPFYNVSKDYLNDCLGSLVNQKTKYKYEIICINDGSTNDTLDNLKNFEKKYPFIRVFSQNNMGISITRNRGIALSKGKYIGFIDQDDWVDTHYIDTLMREAYRCEADVVKCSYSVLEDGKVIESEQIPDDVIRGYVGEKIFAYTGMIWSGIYKKSLFSSIRFPESYWYEDMVTRFLLYRSSKIFASVSKELYFKRKHDTNASVIVWRSNNNKCLEHVYLVYQLLMYNDKILLPRDNVLLEIVLDELGPLMWWRLRGLEKKAKKLAFLLAASCVDKAYLKKTNLSMEDNLLLNIYKKRNYNAWLLFSFGKWLSER